MRRDQPRQRRMQAGSKSNHQASSAARQAFDRRTAIPEHERAILEQEYFADGMVEDIITALSRFKSLFVIARNTSFIYKGKPVNIKQVGRELGVRYVLEGSVRKAADRVRITGQLIQSAANNHLWAEKFDGKLEDISRASGQGGGERRRLYRSHS